MKSKELQEIIGHPAKVFNYRKNKKPNQFRLTRSYFYHSGFDSSKFALKIKEILTQSNIPHLIIDSGDHWHSFVGGAKSGSNNDSFLYVIVEIL